MRAWFAIAKGKPANPEYYTYASIPLRVYFTIQETKDFKRLSSNGIVDEQASIRWEAIIKEYERSIHSLQYSNRINDLKHLVFLISQYVIVKASLCELLYKVDRTLIADLATRGYLIKTTSDADYAMSISDNLRVVMDLITKLEMKRKAMEAEATEPENTNITFDFVMAQLSSDVGFAVPEDVTLARYTEYQKVLRRKRRPQPRHDDGE